jgi:hypothetical protein
MRAAGLEGILKVPDANAFWSLTTSLPSLPTLSCWSPAFAMTMIGRWRVRSSERTWLHSRKPSAAARFRLTMMRS